MIEIDISSQILEIASKRANLQKINSYSFTTNGKLFGIIAEELFIDKYKKAIRKNTRHYDIEYNDLKLDIKAKSCKSAPLPNYTASVSDYQKKHKSDGYVFYRIQKDLKKAWELGGALKNDFFSRATYVPAGTRDGPFLCKVDMWSLPIDELSPLTHLFKEI